MFKKMFDLTFGSWGLDGSFDERNQKLVGSYWGRTSF